MKLRITSLTAVAALSLSTAGVMAQDATQTEAPAAVQQGTVEVVPADTVATEVQAAAETTADAASDTAGGAADAVAETASDAADAVTETASDAVEAVTGAADDAAQATEEAAADAASTTEEAATDAAEATEEAAADTAETAEETAADTAEAAEAATAADEPAADAAHAEAAADDGHGDAAEGDHAAEGEGDHGGDAGHAVAHIEDVAFSFEGPFGKYDQMQLQRGLQVYTEVCAACHGLRYVPLRTLSDKGGPGLPEDQMRAYAAAMDVYDPELDEDRPRKPTDHFPTVKGDGMGPDLSLMAKARAGFHGPYGTGLSQLFNGIGGPEYIHGILTSYTGGEQEQAGTLFYENTAFAGGLISMPPPLSEDLVEYQDGTPATVDQMAKDVSAFLMWTAEPKMMDRKQVGFVSVIFLILLTVLLYLTNKRLWAPHKGKH